MTPPMSRPAKPMLMETMINRRAFAFHGLAAIRGREAEEQSHVNGSEAPRRRCS